VRYQAALRPDEIRRRGWQRGVRLTDSTPFGQGQVFASGMGLWKGIHHTYMEAGDLLSRSCGAEIRNFDQVFPLILGQ
jgi:hypothetical protein